MKKDPDKKEPEDDTDSNKYICKKDTLQNIIHYSKIQFDPIFHGVLIDAVDRVNKTVFHFYLFTKMYFLHLLEQDNIFPRRNNIYPTINVQFVRDVMNTITYKNENRGRKSKITESVLSIQNFYDNYYRPMLLEEDLVCRDNLKAILNYEERDIIKNIKNNISEHYISHLRFFIKVKYGFDKKLEKINGDKIIAAEKKLLRYEIYQTMNKIISDIINVNNAEPYKSDNEYHCDITYFKMIFIPFKEKFDEDSIPYDVKAHPLDYVLQMIQINKELEKINDQIIQNNKNEVKQQPLYKLFNALPLRKEIVPKYITLDTVSLIDLFITTNSKEYRDNPSFYAPLIWSTFFKIETRSFRQKGYKFNYMIKTDGLACSIVLSEDNEIVNDKESEKENERVNNKEIPYIDRVPIYELLGRMNGFVYMDPGKNDLFNGMKKTKDGSLKYFKYTQRQRTHYTKKKKYQRIREKLSAKKIVDNKTVKDIEASLKDYNSKTCDLAKFQLYASKKIEVNRLLFDFYKNSIFRKLNWNAYINRRRNEDMMLNKFAKEMGSPKETTIILGDWSKQGLKGKEATITKRVRKLFVGRGYIVYLIDEHKTSKICSHCHNLVECLKVGDQTLWKLVRCTTCGAIHNRDHNAPKNMMFITMEIIIGGKEHLNVFKRDE